MAEQERRLGPPVFVATRYLRTPTIRLAVFAKTYRLADIVAVVVGAVVSLPGLLVVLMLLPGTMKILALGVPVLGGALGWYVMNSVDRDGLSHLDRLRPAAMVVRAPQSEFAGRQVRAYVGTSPYTGGEPRRILLTREH